MTKIDWDKIIHAIHMVETHGLTGPILGDGGAALGPLQIHRNYWLDSKVQGTYEDCASLEYSRRVVIAYMARYATRDRLGFEPTPEVIARIHNGGPNGYKKKATLKYWEKVKNYYESK